MPKGTDLSVHTPDDLQAIADELSNRPRKVLSWLIPPKRSTSCPATKSSSEGAQPNYPIHCSH